VAPQLSPAEGNHGIYGTHGKKTEEIRNTKEQQGKEIVQGRTKPAALA
jgi:hypothetical protein